MLHLTRHSSQTRTRCLWVRFRLALSMGLLSRVGYPRHLWVTSGFSCLWNNFLDACLNLATPPKALGSQQTDTGNRRRKLPGPAGLLPKVFVSDEIICSIQSKHPSDDITAFTKRIKIQKNNEVFPNRFSLPHFVCQVARAGFCSVDESHTRLLSTGSQSEESELFARVRTDCGSTIWPLIEKYSVAGVLSMVRVMSFVTFHQRTGHRKSTSQRKGASDVRSPRRSGITAHRCQGCAQGSVWQVVPLLSIDLSRSDRLHHSPICDKEIQESTLWLLLTAAQTSQNSFLLENHSR